MTIDTDKGHEPLKPCPFCGSRRLSVASSHYIHCADCSADGPFLPDDEDGEEAIKAWNRRPS